MQNLLNSLESALGNLSCESSELLDYPRPLCEASHEHADNHENVIYTYQAHENVRNASNEERSEAESQLEDCGGVHSVNGSSTYDSTAILLSFYLEENRFRELVGSELENLTSTLEDLMEEVTDFLMNCEDDDDELEDYEELNDRLTEYLGNVEEITG